MGPACECPLAPIRFFEPPPVTTIPLHFGAAGTVELTLKWVAQAQLEMETKRGSR